MSVRTQAEDHIEQSSPIYIDYGDYTDYANDIDYGDGVINRNQCNQSMSVTTQASDHVKQSSANIDYGDATDYGDYTDYANDIDYDDGVISRNHRNQYMPAITQVSDDVGQSSSTWIDYDDYSGGPRDAQRDNSKQAMK